MSIKKIFAPLYEDDRNADVQGTDRQSTSTTIRAIAATSKAPLITAAERKQIEEWSATYEAAQRVREAESVHTAANEARQHLADMQERILAGETVSQDDHWTSSELKADKRAKRFAAKEAQRAVTAELLPVAKEVWQRFETVARRLLAQLDERNRKEAEQFGIAAQDTLLMETIKSVIRNLPQRIPMANIAVDPKSVFADLF